MNSLLSATSLCGTMFDNGNIDLDFRAALLGEEGAAGSAQSYPPAELTGEGARQKEHIGRTTNSTPSTVLALAQVGQESQHGCSDWHDAQAASSVGPYIREDYAVRHHWVSRILKIFNVDKSKVRDAFASVHNRRFDKYFDKQQDALQQVWSKEEIYWCNPPWSLWPAAVNKIEKSSCETIAVVPAWNKPWVSKALGLGQRMIYLESGTKLFELYNKVVPGIRWGIYIIWIPVISRSLAIDAQMLYAGWSSSARRRWRRRLRQQSVASTEVPLATSVAST